MLHGSASNILRTALRSVFGRTCAYLGDELFDVCAVGYIAQNPCTFRSLQVYGDGFSGWLGRMLADHPLVAELASLEWALGDAHDAVDAASLRRAGSRLALHPSTRVLALDWNTMAVWDSLRRGDAPPEAEALPQQALWLVWRRDGRAHYRELDAMEADALRGFRPGCSASGSYLQQWLAQGVLVPV